MFSLIFTAGEQSKLIALFAAVLLALGATILWLVRKPLVAPVVLKKEKIFPVEN
jgi:hypothetical protein